MTYIQYSFTTKLNFFPQSKQKKNNSVLILSPSQGGGVCAVVHKDKQEYAIFEFKSNHILLTLAIIGKNINLELMLLLGLLDLVLYLIEVSINHYSMLKQKHLFKIFAGDLTLLD